MKRMLMISLLGLVVSTPILNVNSQINEKNNQNENQISIYESQIKLLESNNSLPKQLIEQVLKGLAKLYKVSYFLLIEFVMSSPKILIDVAALMKEHGIIKGPIEVTKYLINVVKIYIETIKQIQ